MSEDVIVDALMFAHKEAQPLIDLQDKLRAAVGKPKRVFVPPAKDPVIVCQGRGDRQPEDRSGDGHPRQARALRGARRGGRRDQDRPGRDLPGSRRARWARPIESAKKKHLRELVLNTGKRRIDGRAARRDPADHLRGRRAAAHPRLGAVHARRDAGAGHHHARHQPGRAAHRGAHRQHRQALPAPLQLPAVFDRRDQAAARRQPARGRPRPPGRARHRPRAPDREGVPLRRSASSRRSSSRTAARRWPRSAAASCR